MVWVEAIARQARFRGEKNLIQQTKMWLGHTLPRPKGNGATSAGPWALAFAAPFAAMPGGLTNFVWPKLLVAATVITWAALRRSTFALPRPVVALGVSGLAVVTLAALLGPAPMAALWGRWPRYEGLPVLLLYAACGVVGARLGAISGPTQSAMARLAAYLLAAVSVGSALGLSLGTGLGVGLRAGSALGNATDQGLLAAMLLALNLPSRDPIANSTPSATPERLLTSAAAGHVAVACTALTVGISGSRSALLAALAVLLLQPTHWRQALAFAASTSAVLLAAPSLLGRALSGTTLHARMITWTETVHLVSQYPFLGVGPSGFLDSIGPHESRSWFALMGVRLVPDSPHSWVLQCAVAGGVIGLLVCVAFVATTCHSAYRAIRQHPGRAPLVAACAAYAIGCLVNFTGAALTPLFAMLLGAAIAVPRRHHSSGRSWPLAAFGLTMVAITFAGCMSDLHLGRALGAPATTALEQVTNEFDAAAAWSPADSDIALLRSQALSRLADLGRHEAHQPAVTAGQSAVERLPSSPAAWTSYGVALKNSGRLVSARAAFSRAISLAPLRPTAHFQRGLVNWALGQRYAALVDVQRAHRLSPQDRVISRTLGEIRRLLTS